MWYVSVSTTIKEVGAVTRTKYDSKQTVHQRRQTMEERWIKKTDRWCAMEESVKEIEFT